MPFVLPEGCPGFDRRTAWQTSYCTSCGKRLKRSKHGGRLPRHCAICQPAHARRLDRQRTRSRTAYQRLQRRMHPDRALAARRRWQQAHRDHIRAYHRAWYQRTKAARLARAYDQRLEAA